jgi:uncharacterized membrane protein YbhN (UPF0104 family)
VTAIADNPRRGAKALWKQPWLHRSLTVALLAVVIVILVRHARQIDWLQVGNSLRNYRWPVLAGALALSAAGYSIYSCFDLLSQRYIGVKLPTVAVMRTAFISYAFNQTLGSLIGAVAFRLRLYSRLGLDINRISRLIFFSVWTNWFGYAALAGGIFALGLIKTPDAWDAKWKLGEQVLQITGFGLLALVASYLTLCVVRSGREITWRKHRIEVPSARLATLQLTLSISHWSVAAAILYLLLGQQIEFITVLGALLLAAIAAVLARIPAGLGVLEAVFIGLLRTKMSVADILAAVLAYRAVYQLTPLTFAIGLYATTELSARQRDGVLRQPNAARTER